MKEYVMIYTFRDLIDFLVDYSKYPKGRPPMRTLAEIQSWDISYDLQRASPAQRVNWRRVYTLKWLYGLVDASTSTNQNEQPFGLKEFAATIISLAETTPTTDIGRRVMPHQVFQLQCIVDSFAVSRGWFMSSRGHIMHSPLYSLRPRCDIDRFMRNKNSSVGLGRFTDTDYLKRLCGKNSAALGCVKILENMYFELINQQAKTGSANRIYDVSPFVCGTGLLEALDIAYSIGLCLLGNTPEALLIIHLQNMLVAKDFLKSPIEMYTIIARWLAPACFGGAAIPTSGFAEVFLVCIKATDSRSATTEGQSSKEEAADPASDIHLKDDRGTSTEGQSSKREAGETAYRQQPPHARLRSQPVFQGAVFLESMPPS